MNSTKTLRTWRLYALRAGGAILLAGGLLTATAPSMRHALAGMPMPGMGGSSGGTMGAVDTGMSEMDMRMTPITGTPTASDWARVDTVIAQTKAATAPYTDIGLAIAGGYIHHTAFTPYAHFSNYQYAGLANRVFDPTRPTSLLYAVLNGKITLGGVMYTAPAADTPTQLAQLLPSTIVSWHQHFNICYLASGVRTGVAQAACQAEGGTWAPTSQWMVHAWIYVPNPAGMFAIKNPALPWPRRQR